MAFSPARTQARPRRALPVSALQPRRLACRHNASSVRPAPRHPLQLPAQVNSVVAYFVGTLSVRDGDRTRSKLN